MPIFGEGTTVEVNDGVAAAFAAFSDVVQINPPAESQVVVPDRNLLSNVTRVEPAFSSRKDAGQFSFVYEQGNTKFDRVEALRDNTDHSFRFTYTDNLRVAFTGRVISNAPQTIQGGVITQSLATIQLTSLITVSDAA